MSDPIQLTSFGVTELEAQHALDRLKVRDVDYADLYFESRTSESVSMEEGIVKRAAKSISQGVGVRATAGEKPDLPTRMNSRRRIRDCGGHGEVHRQLPKRGFTRSGAHAATPHERSLSDGTGQGRSRDV